MEQQLGFGISLLRSDVRVEFLRKNQNRAQLGEGEVHIDRSKLESCPNETQFIEAMQKKISRSDLYKSKKHTLGLCILLMASRGYCVSSAQLNEIEDTFVERCWECIKNVSDNVLPDVSNWMTDCMENRSAPKYSMLFLNIKDTSSTLNLLGNYLSGRSSASVIDAEKSNIPMELWHRDDVVKQTMVLHTSLGYRKFSDNGKRS